jgi:PadR family transcriptional regulator, regulatory protein PadR
MADVLGAFEQAVLLAVIRLRDDAYGRAIVDEVAERLRRDVSIGAVHATLVRLERKGMLASRLAPGTARRAGRRRRFYRVDACALRALDEARTSYSQMWRGIRWPIAADA